MEKRISTLLPDGASADSTTMVRKLADGHSYPPRGMRRETAAWYIGVGVTKFDEWVADGRMPKPKRVDGCVIWDRLQLEAAFDDLPAENEFNEWDDVIADPVDRKKQGIDDSGSSKPQDQVRSGRFLAGGIEISDPQLVEKYRASGWRIYEEGEWEELVRKSPLTKLEHRALEGYFKSKGTFADVKGSGPATCDRLQARGFITVVKERGDGKVPYYGITPAGEDEWLRITEQHDKPTPFPQIRPETE